MGAVSTHRDDNHVLRSNVVKERKKANITVHKLEVEAVEIFDVKLSDEDARASELNSFRYWREDNE